MDKIEQLIREIKDAIADGQLSFVEALRIARLIFEILNELLPLIIGKAAEQERKQSE